MTTLDHPKLRLLDSQWSEHDGQPVLVLRDRLGLTRQIAVVPPVLAVLLGLLDGSRDLEAVRAAFALRTGSWLGREQLEDILGQLDQALLLDSPRFAQAASAALAEYRGAPYRPMALAGQVYPADAENCRHALESYCPTAEQTPAAVQRDVRLVICPHIDYQRGGQVYYRTWLRAVRAMEDVEVVVLFGTDHLGGPGRVTLTRQSYQTPFGPLPTATDVVDAVAAELGEEASFGEELHHRVEHSIELGAVWLAYALGGRPAPTVPLLCGSFHGLVNGSESTETMAHLDLAIGAIAEAIGGKRTLVVAAADFAHVGPDFGDPAGLGPAEKAELARTDRRLLDRIVQRDPEGFLDEVRQVGDRYRVCGLPPIYLALRLTLAISNGMATQGSTQGGGEVVAYEQCPTPSANGSWVSVAGALIE